MQFVVNYYAELVPSDPADLPALLQHAAETLSGTVDYVGSSGDRVVVITENVPQEV